MASDNGLQQRAATLSGLSEVFRSLFTTPDSGIVNGYVELLQQTQLVAAKLSVEPRVSAPLPCQGLNA